MSNAQLVEQSFRLICPVCGLDGHKVETVLEERGYQGDLFGVFIIARNIIHLHRDGNKKLCRENLRNPWLFTLCDLDEVDQVRRIAAAMMAKFGDTKLLRFV